MKLWIFLPFISIRGNNSSVIRQGPFSQNRTRSDSQAENRKPVFSLRFFLERHPRRPASELAFYHLYSKQIKEGRTKNSFAGDQRVEKWMYYYFLSLSLSLSRSSKKRRAHFRPFSCWNAVPANIAPFPGPCGRLLLVSSRWKIRGRRKPVLH